MAAPDLLSSQKPRRDNSLVICKQTTAAQWMHFLKLLGQPLSARDFDRQVAEIQISVAILNRFTALGTPKTVAAA